MRITLTWLRLDGRQRWRSLTVLALLVALATTTVLTAVAGARRGSTAFDRLWARTLPSTAAVLPNQPGFDWAKVRALPEVAALTEFPVTYAGLLTCCTSASTGFAVMDDQMGRTLERPVMLAGRMYNPNRANEVIATPRFAAVYGKGVGATMDIQLPTVAQANNGYDGTTGRPTRARHPGARRRDRPDAVGPRRGQPLPERRRA